jgi:hypothetical protein
VLELKEEIKVYPPLYKNSNGDIVTPEPVVFKKLDIQYIDHPANKTYYFKIANLPMPVLLFSGENYNLNITKQQAHIRFAEILGSNPSESLLKFFPATLEQHPNGPGTILAGMFEMMGIQSVENCSCKQHAIQMNQMGNQWCEENIDVIVGWLEKEAKNRNLMFFAPIAKMLVNRAIKKSKKLLKG